MLSLVPAGPVITRAAYHPWRNLDTAPVPGFLRTTPFVLHAASLCVEGAAILHAVAVDADELEALGGRIVTIALLPFPAAALALAVPPLCPLHGASS